jgi:BrnA antitoxin of type II toxin-antitoxin system
MSSQWNEGWAMRKEYDFSRGRRGAVIKGPTGKTRITIRLDKDVLAWFKSQIHKAGGGSYQTLINRALREHLTAAGDRLEEKLRRVLREELPAYRTKRGRES